MRILVLVKQVPDTWGDRRIDPSTFRVDRGEGDQVMDEVSERAVETAVRQRESAGGEVTVLTMGPPKAEEALRRSLAMGADRGIHIVDPELAGSDAVQTAYVISGAIANETFDLIVAGNVSTDGQTGLVPAMISEIRNIPLIGSVDEVTVSGDILEARRVVDDGLERLRVVLPAVISVTERAPEPRFPSLKGILGAKRKPITRVTMADALAAQAGARSVVTSATPTPARTAGRVVTDDGTGASQVLQYLVDERLV